MKKILIALLFSLALCIGCTSTPTEPIAITAAEGLTNRGDKWTVITTPPEYGSAIVYNITSENYSYNFSLGKQTVNGQTIYPCVIMEQTGEVYAEDRWDTYEFNVGGELISLKDPLAYALEGEKKGLAISGQVTASDIEKMAHAAFVDVMLSNYDDSSVNIINTLPIEYQAELLNL